MKQQINLYQSAVRQDRQPFSAARLAQTLAGLLALAVLVSGLVQWDYHRQRGALEAARQQRNERQQEIARLEAQFPPPQEDPLLKARLDALEQELAAKQQFLARFSGQSLGNTSGFSAAMAALAGQPLPGLWLRAFRFHGNGALSFEGGAADPRAVPAFVARLGSEPVFSGRQFQTLKIERSGRDPRYLDFSLQSAGGAP